MAESRREFVQGIACQEVVELATEYLEGSMTEERRTRFELHLNLCDGCFNFVEQVRTTAAMARVLSEEEVPDETRAKLIAAFRDWKRE
jgi:predicted anti-sigma-YlaC factor YlaD